VGKTGKTVVLPGFCKIERDHVIGVLSGLGACCASGALGLVLTFSLNYADHTVDRKSQSLKQYCPENVLWLGRFFTVPVFIVEQPSVYEFMAQ
jgi:hypothetical protein